MSSIDRHSSNEQSAAAEQYRYEAFISYRHVEPDRNWARWLHSSLETYRTPRVLVRAGAARRLARVFRDEEELAASSDLNEEIEAALRASRFLIVVCSPRTPDSRWVNREVQRFQEMGRHGRILALLIEGSPQDSFPHALKEIPEGAVATGNHGRRAIQQVEPLAADVRALENGSAARRLKLAKLRIIARILGVRFDDLRQRERVRNQRRRVVASGLAAIALLTIGAGLRLELRARDLRQARDLSHRFEDDLARIKSSDWPAARFQEIDATLAAWDRVAPQESVVARGRLDQEFVNHINTEMLKPNLDAAEFSRIRDDIDCLARRNTTAAKPLNTEFRLHLRNWNQVALLQPPFDELGHGVFAGVWATALNRDGGVLRFRAPSQYNSYEHTLCTGIEGVPPAAVEVMLGETWEERGGRRGICLLGEGEGLASSASPDAYNFTVDVFGIDRSHPAVPVAATPMRVARGTTGSTLKIQIMRGKSVLRSRSWVVKDIPPGPLRLRATREAAQVTIQVDDLPPLQFNEDFPAPLNQSSRVGLSLRDGDIIQRLEVSRKLMPAAPMPLEVADDFFVRGHFDQALAEYVTAGTAARVAETRQEARYKQAICLLKINRTGEAIDLLTALTSESGKHWPVASACQLWLAYLQHGHPDEAAIVMDMLGRTGITVEEVVQTVSDELRTAIRGFYAGTARSYSLLNETTPEQVERLQRLTAVETRLQWEPSDRADNQFSLLQALESRNEFEAAQELAEKMIDDPTYHAQSFFASILEEHCCLMRLSHQANHAIEQVNALLASGAVDREGGMLEQARLYEFNGRPADAERVLREDLSTGQPQMDAKHDASAHLMLGFLLDEAGKGDEARRVWREGWRRAQGAVGAEDLRPDSAAETLRLRVANDGLTGGLLCASLGCLSDIQDSEIVTLYSAAVQDRGYMSGPVLFQQGVMRVPPSVLRNVFSDPRGRAWARKIAFRSACKPQLAREIARLFVEHFLRDGAFGDTATAEQADACRRAAAGAVDGLATGKLASKQMFCAALAWKGSTGSLGWGGVAPDLDPRLRAPLAYITAMHQVRSARPAQAQQLLEQAAGQRDDALTARMAREELDRRFTVGNTTRPSSLPAGASAPSREP